MNVSNVREYQGNHAHDQARGKLLRRRTVDEEEEIQNNLNAKNVLFCFVRLPQ
jgi:hypothetical protein